MTNKKVRGQKYERARDKGNKEKAPDCNIADSAQDFGVSNHDDPTWSHLEIPQAAFHAATFLFEHTDPKRSWERPPQSDVKESTTVRGLFLDQIAILFARAKNVSGDSEKDSCPSGTNDNVTATAWGRHYVEGDRQCVPIYIAKNGGPQQFDDKSDIEFASDLESWYNNLSPDVTPDDVFRDPMWTSMQDFWYRRHRHYASEIGRIHRQWKTEHKIDLGKDPIDPRFVVALLKMRLTEQCKDQDPQTFALKWDSAETRRDELAKFEEILLKLSVSQAVDDSLIDVAGTGSLPSYCIEAAAMYRQRLLALSLSKEQQVVKLGKFILKPDASQAMDKSLIDTTNLKIFVRSYLEKIARYRQLLLGMGIPEEQQADQAFTWDITNLRKYELARFVVRLWELNADDDMRAQENKDSLSLEIWALEMVTAIQDDWKHLGSLLDPISAKGEAIQNGNELNDYVVKVCSDRSTWRRRYAKPDFRVIMDHQVEEDFRKIIKSLKMLKTLASVWNACILLRRQSPDLKVCFRFLLRQEMSKIPGKPMQEKLKQWIESNRSRVKELGAQRGSPQAPLHMDSIRRAQEQMEKRLEATISRLDYLRSIPRTVHCEIQLLLVPQGGAWYLPVSKCKTPKPGRGNLPKYKYCETTQGEAAIFPYIGCSKLSCYSCWATLQSTGFRTRNTHSQLFAGCAFPIHNLLSHHSENQMESLKKMSLYLSANVVSLEALATFDQAHLRTQTANAPPEVLGTIASMPTSLDQAHDDLFAWESAPELTFYEVEGFSDGDN